MNYEVINGDNINKLKNYPDNYFDSVVTDPPYGLGKEPNAAELMKDWIEHGYHEIDGKGFMGKEWDAFVPQPIFWKEVFRVLKPGGHVLAFYGTRTYDWGVMAMRFAGFEVRDCIQWLYGSGFPKSHNISKAIDKKGGNPNLTTDLARDLKKARESRGISKTKADEMFCGGTTLYSWYEGRKDGIQLPTSMYMRKIADAFPELEKYVGLTMEAEREVIGTINKARSSSGDFAMPTMGGETIYKNIDITTSTTENAKQWDGWGTALKPANEPIVLARKPLEKGLSIAENILKWGVGGINIDASRIGYNENIDFDYKSDRKSKVYGGNSLLESKTEYTNNEYNAQGRFPANIILTHHEDCVCKGTKKVKAIKGGCKFESAFFKSGESNFSKDGGIGDADGNETIENWDCHEDCPIRILDEQSGVLKSGGGDKATKGKELKNYGIYGKYTPTETKSYQSDKGGASRFFKSANYTQDELVRFQYVAKASKSERNKGLDDFEEKQTSTSDIAAKRYVENVNCADGKYQAAKAPNQNFHPTVKPVKLMQYLVKMITPRNGIVLDPFCGSGSTGVACKLDGFNFVGIEQDLEYTKIAEARIKNTEIELKQLEIF